MKASFSVIAFFLFSATPLAAQSFKFQIWSDISANYTINEQLQLKPELGYRIEPDSKLQSTYLRAALHIKTKAIFSFDAGIANFLTWEPQLADANEFRLFEYAFISWPELAGFKIKFRFGLEQRWFSFSELAENEFVHRGRVRIELSSPEFNFWNGASMLYGTINYEALRNVNDDIVSALFNQNRFMAGLGYDDKSKYKFELHYQIMGRKDDTVSDIFTDVHLVRIRLYYYF